METNIKNEIIDINQDLKKYFKIKKYIKEYSLYFYYIFIRAFIYFYMLFIILKEQFKGYTIADFINSFIPSFENLRIY